MPREGLRLAMQRKDTSEVIQALNNIGTNFRRLGIMDEASNYHYRALSLCERLGDKESYKARKNRTISLSGIGNVYLTLENCEMADSIFRIALEEERTLDSDLGLAMNYANLGSIFEMRGMMVPLLFITIILWSIIVRPGLLSAFRFAITI